jgi:hypothetical protein
VPVVQAKAPAATVAPITPPKASVATASPAPALQTANESVTKPVKQASHARSGKRDEDVALLEAMFAHTGARKPPASVAEELASTCGGLSGAQAATCRARICVQHPTASVCHPDQ